MADAILAPQTAIKAATIRAKAIFIILFVTNIQFIFVPLRWQKYKKYFE